MVEFESLRVFYFNLNIFVAFLALLFAFSQKSKEHKVFFFLIGVSFVFLIGLRGNEDEYTRLFIRVPELGYFFSDISIALETGFGFSLICSSLKTLGFSSQALLFIFAFLSITINLYYFRKFTVYFILAFLIYLSHEVIHHEWIQIRSGLVSALLLPMIYALKNKNFLLYFLLFIFSLSIHYISVFSLLLIFANYKYKTISIIYIFFLSLLLNIVGGAGIILNFLSSLSFVPPRVELYLNWDKHNYQVSFLHPKLIQQIITSVILIYMYRRFPSFRKNYLIINTYILATFFLLAFSDFAILAFRSSSHFICVEPILLTLFIPYIKHPQFVQFGFVILFIIISYVNYVHNEALSNYLLFVPAQVDISG